MKQVRSNNKTSCYTNIVCVCVRDVFLCPVVQRSAPCSFSLLQIETIHTHTEWVFFFFFFFNTVPSVWKSVVLFFRVLEGMLGGNQSLFMCERLRLCISNRWLSVFALELVIRGRVEYENCLTAVFLSVSQERGSRGRAQ